jgi:hypothetical protein
MSYSARNNAIYSEIIPLTLFIGEENSTFPKPKKRKTNCDNIRLIGTEAKHCICTYPRRSHFLLPSILPAALRTCFIFCSLKRWPS